MTTGIGTMCPNLFHYSTIVCYSFWCYSTFIYIVCQKWQREFQFLAISMTFFGTMLWIYLPRFGHGQCYSVKKKNGGGKKKCSEVRMSLNEIRWGINNAKCDNIRFQIEWILWQKHTKQNYHNKMAKSGNCCDMAENRKCLSGVFCGREKIQVTGLFNFKSVPSVTFR